MCGGNKGPSAFDLAQQELAAKGRAQAESDLVRAQRDLGQSTANASLVANQAAMANQDAARRQRNRTLLAGLAFEEGSALKPLEDSTSKSSAKAKRATLIGGI